MTQRRPHVVGVVGNDIAGDARVRKVAAAAAAAGFSSTIVCYAPTGVRRETQMGRVRVIRVPVPFVAHAKNSRVPAPLRPFNASELAARHAGPRIHLLARKRWVEGRLLDAGLPRYERLGLRGLVFWIRLSLKLRHESFRARRKAHLEIDRAVRRFNRGRVRTALRLFAPLRDPIPNIADYEAAFGPVLEELEPDLIHAHDVHMIGIAVTAARNLRSRGRATKVVYDAHEWLEGLQYPRRTLRGWLRLEGRYIRSVDAVVGVSPDQVSQLQHKYALNQTPAVVLNAPVAVGGDTSRDLRSDLGHSGKLLVYHGNIFPERGVGTLLEALTLLDDDCHLAILAPDRKPLVDDLRRRAADLGVNSRTHILPYVPAEDLPSYLRSADLAVLPFLPTANNDISLPNKLFEAFHAGLPVLVSDMRSMSHLVHELGVGEVFHAGDPTDLAKRARAILSDPVPYRARITNELKDEYSWDRQAATLTSVYHRLLGSHGPAHPEVTASDIREDPTSRGDPQRPTRLAIGPRNMAGQAFLIAASVQERLAIPAISISLEKPTFGFPVHLQVTQQQWRDPSWQENQRRLLATGFTHVVAESGTGMLGSLNGGFIDDQLELLQQDGIEVSVLLHGSEIRDPSRHKHLPYSPYAADHPLIHALVEAQARLRKRLDRLDVPIFVTTPDLLLDISAQWLPVVVDVRQWQALPPAFRSDVPRVLHLPTNPLLKGSEYVDAALRELEEEGRIRYIRPADAPAASVPSLIADADIVVDQLLLGAYGVMSCQAMAAGRVVVANVRDIGPLRAECPIVHADPGSLQSCFSDLLDARKRWKDLGEAGRTFVRRYHDGTETARVLQGFLDK